MRKGTRAVVLVAAAAAASAGGIGVAAAAGGGDDTETRIPRDALERASAAALEHTGGGRVTGTEVDDEESKYEVEVTLDDGGQVDVQLDEAFEVVGDKVDGESDPTDD